MVGADNEGHNDLEFGILGPLQVLRDGTQLSLGGPQQRAVLALLLTKDEGVATVAQIADAVWGEQPPAGFATTIQTYIFHLREVLEPTRAKGAPATVLVTEPGGYRLRPDNGSVDAAEFERLADAGNKLVAGHRYEEASVQLRQALALWRGRVLADVGDYEFVRQHAAHLDEVRLNVTESRIDADLALGRHATLIAELDTLTELHPLREHLQAQRLLALYRTGRQAEALSSYRSIRQRLQEELGIEPGRELHGLHQSMLNHDPDLHVDSPAPAPARPITTAPIGGPQTTRRPRRGRRVIAASLLGAAAVTVATTVYVANRSAEPGLASLPANSLGAVAMDGSLRTAVKLGQNPDSAVLADGAAWVTNTGDGTVSRIDLKKHLVVQTTPVQASPQAITASATDVWVANSGAASVSRISLTTSQLVNNVPVGNLPTAIASGPSGVWVANRGDDTVIRINPGTGEVGKPIPVGLRPDGIAVGSDTVWVSNSGDGTVSPIDPDTGVVGSSIAVGAGPAGIAVTPGAVWVANSLGQTVSRIDPTTRRVVSTIGVGDGPRSIVLARNRVWVANEFDGTTTLIDPASNRAVKRIATGASPRGLGTDGKSVWVTTRAFTDKGHRGGTLRITHGHLPDWAGIDPTNGENVANSAFSLVYDGLVGMQRTGGASGLTLVPDLAVDLPRPSEDGKVYVFTLRRGIHYSTGAEVRPADIRRGVQQALTVYANPALFAGIVGASDCIRLKTKCELSKGVEIDDVAFRVVFHLREPDPDFLYKLTAPVYATPEASPGVPATKPRPATGPYMIGEYGKGKPFTLVRNPQFRQWSFAAQPDGYPDVIQWTRVPDRTRAVKDVLAGRADAEERQLDPDLHLALYRSNSSQFHSDFSAWTMYMFLNTKIAPFNDVRARKAINLAVDRNEIVRFFGGTTRAEATCQVLPANFPSHQRYCPYTINPSPDGGYHGPDLAGALKLVSKSPTRGMPVTVITPFDDPAALAACKYIASVLSKLGYKTRFEPRTEDLHYFERNNPGQIGLAGWGMDYPAPSTFFSTVSCSSDLPGHYCNHDADKLAHDALDKQNTDPPQAHQLWAKLDRMITADAAWLSLVNTQTTIVVSKRVGNYQSNARIGPLYGQMWVQ